MQKTLRALADGELTVEEAEAKLSGYATTDAGRFDAVRETRRGIPEAILSDGKATEEIISLTQTALNTTDRAIITRIDETEATMLKNAVDDTTIISHDKRARTVIMHSSEFKQPTVEAAVAIVTGGTADLPVAGEAKAITEAIGIETTLITDVGVANLTRMVDQLDRIKQADVVIVAAGREGALPTVVAGLVDAPVIGLPTSIGYGAGGKGEAALYGMLQSCTVLTTVNIDAGFTAGAQAGLIARRIAGDR
ncbi:nickel pincer cofactor biosynthesis protein LarB [Natronocalculus amylovorans]|uniref:Nickel pincer cofactor biosynthesis protein LarB n=1 Tax=Natronocalculus amylovorans TaxID=2917812 RepID=A0AAE3FVJ5_9EURY|nr:nickel pincer cofactor biosynthesis protein LarB [Natronocalculus amylovorans]MCL9815940.1 nickel pincer cofactor biosynthesis protein LarB [Natronocalculus amylovorans]NUE01544.1 nickel pincer cofactor biosynthesis protein LarB [Halorubraceae archaeon YAN]